MPRESEASIWSSRSDDGYTVTGEHYVGDPDRRPVAASHGRRRAGGQEPDEPLLVEDEDE